MFGNRPRGTPGWGVRMSAGLLTGTAAGMLRKRLSDAGVRYDNWRLGAPGHRITVIRGPVTRGVIVTTERGTLLDIAEAFQIPHADLVLPDPVPEIPMEVCFKWFTRLARHPSPGNDASLTYRVYRYITEWRISGSLFHKTASSLSELILEYAQHALGSADSLLAELPQVGTLTLPTAPAPRRLEFPES